MINDYESRYHGVHKFILEPQLERLCEKYNLYVRSPRFFIGDIPEKNITDMMNFRIHIKDLPYGLDEYLVKLIGDFYLKTIDIDIRVEDRDIQGTIGLSQIEKLLMGGGSYTNSLHPIIEIAAVKPLFSQEAFKNSDARIVQYESTQATAKGQVDLDPIVLVKTKVGRLIVTAWGDEANDELVLNKAHN